ncbi:MAG: 2-C-methyl-D-erythritol 2,4-cyclodiphosphate synthase [Holosporales bacterium]|jgi:2-C-methyl-D-erythritol 4-phosphate cytidylyltransferase/2-C-methyl-D-erythritol 2,4-cyclodiphosphate synthase|nr:2-C-methyl-D-erythritol 2,4-cyclodiphosphate synthase [Holosporales bacterium]
MSSTSRSRNLKQGRGKVIAIVAAAGSGSRYGSALPKQFVSVGGKSPLKRSVELLASVEEVDRIVCVIPDGFEAIYEVARCSAEQGKLLKPVAGGRSRGESVRLALEAIAEHSPEYVLVHDAARCFCPQTVVANVVSALISGESAVVPAVEPVDSMRLQGCSVNRGLLRAVQTPQGFRYNVLRALHEKYKDFELSDDATLCDIDNIPVCIVSGDAANKKLTHKNDAGYAATHRVGFGYDAHRFSRDPSRKLRLMGIEIPGHRGLEGVSDADAGIHSIVDAILGALGRGSIGEHFPESAPAHQGADSRIFLKYCRELMVNCNADVVNIDATIVCESPNIATYAAAMKSEIAKGLLMDDRAVNVKGKTTEGMGFEGRREGISAYSVVTLRIIE